MDPESRLRRSRTFATLGFILLATSGLLSWWSIRTYEDGDEVVRVELQFWDQHQVASSLAQGTTGILVAAALVILFVRIAAGSWKHEPSSWRRDLVIAAALVAVALASAFLWPTDVPTFWDTNTGTIDSVDVVEKARPGLGWWTGLVAVGFLALAWETGRAKN